MREGKLKPLPCPFCGRKPKVSQGGGAYTFIWYVECENDWHQITVQGSDTRNDAIKNWNDRY